MRVLHIVRQFSPAIGGLEAAVLSLAIAQRERLGIDARVVTLDRMFQGGGRLPTSGIVAGVPVHRLPWRGSTRYPLAPAVLGQVRSADLLHVHAIDFFFDFLALTRPWHGRRMIASTHGGFFHTGQFTAAKRLWFNTVTRASIQAYRHIVACSHSDADMFRGAAGSRLAVIENGIDQAKFRDAASRAPTRTILSFGRFAHHKRIGHLFPVLAWLRRADPSWRLILAGGQSGQTAEALIALAREAGVQDAVRFVIDPSDDRLRGLMGEASYFACLSAHEGFGLAAVEAMSAGLTPILSDIAPFLRLTREGGVGLIIDVDDPAGAAAMIEAMALDLGLAQRRRQAIEVARRYDWHAVAGRYTALYEETLSNSRATAAIGAVM